MKEMLDTADRHLTRVDKLAEEVGHIKQHLDTVN
jgi:hypothetical protein